MATARKPAAKTPASIAPAPKPRKLATTANAKAPKESKIAAKPKPASDVPLALVRDRFSMPQVDFDRIAVLKLRARKLGRPSKKSELLRAGLQQLQTLTDESLLLALDQLEPTKPPKPKRKSAPLDER